MAACCVSVNLCGCEHIYLCVCERAWERACCSRAPPPPHDPPRRRGAEAAGRPAGPGGRGRDPCRGEPFAPPSPPPPPRRLCPLNRSPSRLQLISHVTFYLLSPAASCPRTVLLRQPRVAPPRLPPGLRHPQLWAKQQAARAPSRGDSPRGLLGLRGIRSARRAAVGTENVSWP